MQLDLFLFHIHIYSLLISIFICAFQQNLKYYISPVKHDLLTICIKMLYFALYDLPTDIYQYIFFFLEENTFSFEIIIFVKLFISDIIFLFEMTSTKDSSYRIHIRFNDIFVTKLIINSRTLNQFHIFNSNWACVRGERKKISESFVGCLSLVNLSFVFLFSCTHI